MSEFAEVPHPPSIDKKSFNCPHCGAHADQQWHIICSFPLKGVPCIPASFSTDCVINHSPCFSVQTITEATALIDNLYITCCKSCKGITIWNHDTIIYPDVKFTISPNSDLPNDIKYDFNEAASILNKSPRGATALLRLAIQKLCIHLGKNKNINKAIGELVEDGLHPKIQKALDVVRVIGNDAVHPGVIDIKDDIITATSLFKLVNIIVEKMISEPKHIEAMFADLPEDKLDAIEQRDKKDSAK